MEQRYDAVLGVLRDGFSVTEVARKFGVSRQSLHSWLARYEAGGLEALDDQSHRPKVSPNQIAPVIEARIIELRRHHPSWGPVRLRHQLSREQTTPLPSESSIYRALKRHALIEDQAKRKVLPTYKRWERSRPMELWQMDVVGGVLLSSGAECKVLTGIDDHSRFIVCAGLMERATARAVCGHLAATLERYGVPEEILTDNGKVFTNRFGLTPAEVLFDRICRENGIQHRLTAPRSPTTTGKIERFHRTLRQECLGEQIFSSFQAAQGALDDFVAIYNTERPHQSLKMATPASRFNAQRAGTPTIPLELRSLDEDRSSDDWISRTVNVNGTITITNQTFSVGKQRSGRIVDVRVLAGLFQVFDGPELIKAVARANDKEVRKKRAEPNRRRPNTSEDSKECVKQLPNLIRQVTPGVSHRLQAPGIRSSLNRAQSPALQPSGR
jgi:transposase InsO family protein